MLPKTKILLQSGVLWGVALWFLGFSMGYHRAITRNHENVNACVNILNTCTETLSKSMVALKDCKSHQASNPKWLP